MGHPNISVNGGELPAKQTKCRKKLAGFALYVLVINELSCFAYI